MAVDYVEVLSQRLPVHQVGGWWTRTSSVDGVVTPFHPFGIVLLHEITSVSIPLLAEDLAEGPQVNMLVGADGAWWVVAAGATNLSMLGHQRPVDCIHQGVPPDFAFGDLRPVNEVFLFVSIVNNGTWRPEQVQSLSLGCSLICRAMHWKGHRVVGERELTGKRFDLVGLDMDDLRRRIQTDELALETG